MKILVYLQKTLLEPRGGPNAVGYYIYLNSKNDNSIRIDFLDTLNKKSDSIIKKILKKSPKFILNIYRKYKRIKTAKNILNIKGENLNFNEYDLVHFHSTLDLYKERESLKNYNGIILLTSHSPVPPWNENISDLSLNEVKKYKKWYDNYKLIDEYAFNTADYITFPCKESEEPYFDYWDKYAQIHQNNQHKYKYILTGIPPCYISKTKETILNNLKLNNNNFIISYIGRHNLVKGFNDLKILGKEIFKENPDIHFIIAGKEYPICGLNHNQWHELGWTNDPHSIIAASDIFVLPNKATYFDIVMLEILSIGKIVVASKTGGNKYFEKLNPKGIFLYNNLNEAKDIILNIKKLTPTERIDLGNDNKILFEKYFTDKVFYENYIKLLKSLQKR